MRALLDPSRRFVVVLIGAAALAAAPIAASQLASGSEPEPVPAAPVSSVYAGIPQSGIALGRDDAPVTLVE